MTGFIDHMEAMSVNVTSPDGSVHGNYTTRFGTKVSFGRRGSAGHSDASLAEQVTAVLGGVAKGFGRAFRIVEERTGTAAPVTDDRPPSKRRRGYGEALADVDVRTTSPRGCVRARFSGTDGMAVRVRPGTVGRMDLDDRQLLAEINAAVTEASDLFGEERARLHRRFFGHRPPREPEVSRA